MRCAVALSVVVGQRLRLDLINRVESSRGPTDPGRISAPDPNSPIPIHGWHRCPIDCHFCPSLTIVSLHKLRLFSHMRVDPLPVVPSRKGKDISMSIVHTHEGMCEVHAR
jgi:hypothetical protein